MQQGEKREERGKAENGVWKEEKEGRGEMVEEGRKEEEKNVDVIAEKKEG